MAEPSYGMLRLPDFRAEVGRSVVPLDVRTERPEAFSGHLEAVTAGAVHVLGLRASAHHVHRTPALIERAPRDYFKFMLVERGRAVIVQDCREISLAPGDMSIYDTARPYSLLFDGDVRLTILMFPRPLLTLPPEAVTKTTATRLSGGGGVSAIMRPYLRSLSRELPVVDQRTSARLARHAVDLAGSLVEAALTSLPATSAAHRDTMRRMLAYIDDHLTSPDLGPSQVAAAHFVSLRHLQGLFGELGTSVSTVIRTRRLERSYDELVRPENARRSVAEIARTNGFVDPAHFSRVFRAHFGAPPSSVRRSGA